MKDKTSINRKSNTGAIERETKVHVQKVSKILLK